MSFPQKVDTLTLKCVTFVTFVTLVTLTARSAHCFVAARLAVLTNKALLHYL